MKRFAFVVFVSAYMLATIPALAHSWYSKRKDPVQGYDCCGGSDCAQLVIEPGVLEAVPEGYHVHLTVDQAKRINPHRDFVVDIVIPWNRVQDSEDGNYHICLPIEDGRVRDDFYCFFAPPST